MGLVVLHLHLHGLLRSHDPELGRDSDTGGQTLYVLELARALDERSEVDLVEVINRRIHDLSVGSADAGVAETLGLWLPSPPIPYVALFSPASYKSLTLPTTNSVVDLVVQL